MNVHVFLPGEEAPKASANIIERKTIEMIVAHRNKALELYSVAHSKMLLASDAIRAANVEASKACPGEGKYNHFNHEKKAKPTIRGQDIEPLDEYMREMRKIVDTDCWAYVIQLSNLESVMDKEAKDQLRQALQTEPPEITFENIRATLEQFIVDADTIFKRGIANCFSSLDRRFRSHDGWKIGGRVILTYAFDEWGGWNYHRNHDDTLIDIERIFLKLDGIDAPLYGGIVDQVRRSRGGHGRRQSEFKNEYFTIRGFKNGNCHIWFNRDDLLDRVNQLLGEYYGAPIPEDRDADPDTGLNDPKTSLAKNYGFFPTPEDAGTRMLKKVTLLRSKEKSQLKILEPSAGTGNIARRCLRSIEELDNWSGGRERHQNDYRFDNVVDCVEFQKPLADALRREGIFRKVYNLDFLLLKPETTGLYDIVAMNPPFDRERDIDHVMHALQFLEDDGTLVAIMSAGTEFRETKKSIAFRALMEKMKADWEDLPAGSFSSVGTNCNTLILRVHKDGQRSRYY